ncbi:MAG: signal recognition particle-docking protein FtsY [Bdellovibrionales bacterium]|nr:signal recognition particle-docking protein FtsY [Bdellovibrionales bacterium]
MNETNASMIDSLADFFRELSLNFGPTGDPILDSAFLITSLAFILLVVAVIAALRRQPSNAPGTELPPGLMGRLERLEMAINNLTTDVARQKEFTSADLQALRSELNQIRTKLGLVEPVALQEPVSVETEAAQESSSDEAPAQVVVEEEVSLAAEDAQEALGAAESSQPAKLSAAPESLSKRLARTREGLLGKIKSVFGGASKIDLELLEDLEELLVTADLGIKTSQALIEELKQEAGSGGELDYSRLTLTLQQRISSILRRDAPEDLSLKPNDSRSAPFVIMVVGVNGVGKTTTSAKLAHQLSLEGYKTMLVAGDTFRAAAVEQLKHWGDKIDVPVVSGSPDAKPATVVFDAMERAKREQFDIVIVDTAGRLHTKSNLMQELEGVRNVMQKHVADAPHETILVVDGATGQNALNQAREFDQALKLSGLVVTKLDGTPKGGIVVAIKNELGIPIRYVGVGEGEEDLRVFDPDQFAAALLTEGNASAVSGSAHAERRRERRLAAF